MADADNVGHLKYHWLITKILDSKYNSFVVAQVKK